MRARVVAQLFYNDPQFKKGSYRLETANTVFNMFLQQLQFY